MSKLISYDTILAVKAGDSEAMGKILKHYAAYIKKSSAQITALYSPEDLLGRQVICCVNLTPMHIGSVKSEVRILGTDSEQGVVLLMPTERVKNGDPVF